MEKLKYSWQSAPKGILLLNQKKVEYIITAIILGGSTLKRRGADLIKANLTYTNRRLLLCSSFLLSFWVAYIANASKLWYPSGYLRPPV